METEELYRVLKIFSIEAKGEMPHESNVNPLNVYRELTTE